MVGSKPPFAYESAKTQAAIPIPTAPSRKNRLCSLFTLIRGTGRYSNAVSGALNRLVVTTLAAGAVVAAALVGPSTALACNGGGPSAVNVYIECTPAATGSKPTTSSPTTGSETPTHVSDRTAKALKGAGSDRRFLFHLVRSSGGSRLVQPRSAGAEPSALGSAFDLGSGPVALLAALAGTALLLLAGNGLRFWRSRRRV